jgi:hypothetical protein
MHRRVGGHLVLLLLYLINCTSQYIPYIDIDTYVYIVICYTPKEKVSV